MTEHQWKQVAESASFRKLIDAKRAFIVPAIVFFVIFYFMLPILTAFTTVLNGKVIGAVNWAYMYAFAQFAMTWILCHMYMNRAARYDQMVEQVKQEASGKGVIAG